MVDTAPGTDRPLNVGFAGLGVGSHEALPVLEHRPEFNLVAAADLRPHALELFKSRYGARVYNDVEAMCADPDVEAVWISTPNNLHAEHALAAARNGKHMVIRKPMALTMEDCQKILDTAAQTGAKILAGGQTQGSNALVQSTRQMILSGKLGRLEAINVWAYTGWLIAPRGYEADESLGGAIIWRQAPHQIEMIRWLGGGMVRSVRAMTGRWRPERPNGSGYYAAYLEFEDGTPVTIVYNAYGFFTTQELYTGRDTGIETRAEFRQGLLRGEVDEEKGKERRRFGAMIEGEGGPQLSAEFELPDPSQQRWGPGNQGVFVVTCDGGDIRMIPDGLAVYDEEGKHEVPVPQPEGGTWAAEPMELYEAVRHNKPMLHDGRWGMATAEVQWAIIESAKERREIFLKHQVPVPEGY